MHGFSFLSTATPRSALTPATLIVALAGLLSACTNQQVYDTAQQNHALECQKYPDSRYEDCMRTVEKDFETYEREREAASEPPKPQEPR